MNVTYILARRHDDAGRAKAAILYEVRLSFLPKPGASPDMEIKMLTVTDGGSLARALKLPIDPRLKRLLIERRGQLDGDIKDRARFIIIQAGDSMNALEQELGWSIFTTPEGYRFGDPDFYPSWEWLADHGHCFEMVFIMTDDGFAHVVLVQQSPRVDPDLLKLCQMYVTDKV